MSTSKSGGTEWRKDLVDGTHQIRDEMERGKHMDTKQVKEQ